MRELMNPINTPDELFHGGNPANGDACTVVTDEWLNDVQASVRSNQSEIISVLNAADMVPDRTDNTQLLAALRLLLSTQKMYRPGQLVAMFSSAPPSGTLVCNGGAVSRMLYDNLFNAIGTKYGAGDGSTTFNLPNIPDGFALLGGGTVGTTTAGSVISHSHSAWTDAQGAHNHAYVISPNANTGGGYVYGRGGAAGYGYTESVGGHAHNVGIGATGGSYNYAVGMKLLMCIAY